MNLLLGGGTYFFSIFKRSSWAVSLIRVGMGVIIAVLIAEVLLAKGFSFIHSFTYFFFYLNIQERVQVGSMVRLEETHSK